MTAKRAAEIPPQREMFKRLYLNICGDPAAVTWVDMAVYDEGADARVELADLAGRSVYVGVDLASVSGLAAVYAVAEADDGGWLVYGKQYCPAEQYRKRVADNLPYDAFAESGRPVVTEGDAIDQDRLIADLMALCGELDVREMSLWPSQHQAHPSSKFLLAELRRPVHRLVQAVTPGPRRPRRRAQGVRAGAGDRQPLHL